MTNRRYEIGTGSKPSHDFGTATENAGNRVTIVKKKIRTVKLMAAVGVAARNLKHLKRIGFPF